jgi:hypothetical protein
VIGYGVSSHLWQLHEPQLLFPRRNPLEPLRLQDCYPDDATYACQPAYCWAWRGGFLKKIVDQDESFLDWGNGTPLQSRLFTWRHGIEKGSSLEGRMCPFLGFSERKKKVDRSFLHRVCRYLSIMAGFTWSLWLVPTAYVLYKVLTFGSREKNLPPGPPTIPVLGNAHLIPLKGLHLKYVQRTVNCNDRSIRPSNADSLAGSKNGLTSTAPSTPSKSAAQP